MKAVYNERSLCKMPMQTQRESEYRSASSQPWCQKGVGVQCHDPVALPLAKRPITHSTGGLVGLGAGLVGYR
jgi:hypothetical protein